MTVETLRKAEAIERTLSLSHHNVDESLPTSDIQMEDAIVNPRPTASAPQDQTTKTPNPPAGTNGINYLASLDLDNPDLNGYPANVDLPYDDSSLTGKFNETLLNTTEAASRRVTEARTLFGPITSILDRQSQSTNKNIPARQVRALTNLYEELTAVAKRHFEAYVRGVATSLLPAENEAEKIPTLRNSAWNKTPHPSSVQALHLNAHTSPSQIPATSIDQCPEEDSTKPISDDRLFLRLPESDALRTISGYALHTLLKSKLGPNCQLLANTLPTKTGFALCPTKGNSASLAEKLATISILHGKVIERASPWKSYRISNVPRKFGTTNDQLELHLEPVTTVALTEAITAAVGVRPISVLASRDNDAQPDSPTTTWIVRFREQDLSLPRVLFLFGYRTTTKMLPRRSTTAQCTRCWLWHNSRVCSSPIRCRLCGSSQHNEQNHKNLCSGPADHTCPPKCIHCHGPHPSDYNKCELRPCPSGNPKTKEQITAIRRVCAGIRLRYQTEAGCCTTSTTENPELICKLPVPQRAPCTNPTSVTSPPINPLNLSPAVPIQSSNPFEILSHEKDLANNLAKSS